MKNFQTNHFVKFGHRNNQPLSQLKSGWEERANQLISCLAKNPLSKTMTDNITSNFQNYRLENKLLNEKIDEMQKDIH